MAGNLFKDKQDSEKHSLQSSNPSLQPIAVAEDEFAFVRANYAFDPVAEQNNQLSFQAGDVIAISKTDAAAIENGESKWIVGRLKDGRSGFFPSNYVSIIK